MPPVDPGIILGVKPIQIQQTDPMESYGKSLALKGLIGQQDLQGLQMQSARQNLDDENAVRSAYQQSGGDPATLRALLYKGGQHKAVQALDKFALETEEKRTNIDKNKAEIPLKQQELVVKETAQHRDELANVNDPQAAAQWVTAGYQNPVLGPIAARAGTLDQALARIPQDPAAFQQWKQQNALGATKFIELNKPNVHVQNTGNASNLVAVPGLGGAPTTLSSTPIQQSPDSVASQATQIRGQNMTNSRALESQNIERVKADPMGVLGINKNPSQAAVAGSGLSGDEYLATLPPGVANQVKAIAEGKLQISPMTSRSPQGAALIQMAMQYEPGTDQTVYQSRASTAKDAASGKLASSNNALNTVVGHLAGLSDAADKLNNTSFPWVNTFKNAVLSATGDPRVKEFNLNAQGVAQELERAYRGAGGSEGSIKEWQQNLGNANSPAQFKAVMAKGAEMLQSKLEANHAQYVQGMHGKPGDYQSITPKSVDALAKLRGESAPATAAQPTRVNSLSQADPAKYSGQVATGDDGIKYKSDGKRWMRVP